MLIEMPPKASRSRSASSTKTPRRPSKARWSSRTRPPPSGKTPDLQALVSKGQTWQVEKEPRRNLPGIAGRAPKAVEGPPRPASRSPPTKSWEDELDNITHTLAGALLGQMGLKRRSRFAFAACLLGANAPDIDVFAPLAFPVDGIEFHRGPLHGVFAWPILAAAIVAILWLLDRLRPGGPDALPFRARPLVRRHLPRRAHPSVPRLADDLCDRASRAVQLALELGRRDLHRRLGLLAADDRRHQLVGDPLAPRRAASRAARPRSRAS